MIDRDELVYNKNKGPAIRWPCLALLVSSVIACGIDQEAFTPAIPANHLVASVSLEYQAYNLATDAPYDTVQLHTTVLSGAGHVMDEPIVYSVKDTRFLEVSTTGRLKTVAATPSTVVYASVTRNGVTRTDSAIVTILAGTPTTFPARVAIEANPGDSAKIAVVQPGRARKTLRLVREDSVGRDLPVLRVAFRLSDPNVLTMTESGSIVGVTPARPGQTQIYVSAYAYGISLRDSLSFRVGWPIRAEISFARVTNLFTNSRVIIGVGGCVSWVNWDWRTDLDVVFDDSLDVKGPLLCSHGGDATEVGNIRPFHAIMGGNGVDPIFPTNYRARSFPKAGVYSYRSTLLGTSGVIVVCDETHDPSCSPENYEWGKYNP